MDMIAHSPVYVFVDGPLIESEKGKMSDVLRQITNFRPVVRTVYDA